MTAYNYITVSDLEDFTGTDYSAVDSDYTDTVIGAKISNAERIVNSICRDDFSGTIPDGVKAATIQIAANLMHNQLVNDGYAENRIKAFDKSIEAILEDSKASNNISVDSVI